ncbi:hypothetical protein [Chitinophaga sp. Cy-1792]|uniref:hypothetical protein n=1 Tax=Chitinophaga sp. Cy-1792 TaxID=2608339 RepID=UPI0014237E74|nr:hypothetical protein [Chitinophaga sp. Cy-1792]NIG54517.1 hypothetical protein [Chitinophaga sp. Cy-1792]
MRKSFLTVAAALICFSAGAQNYNKEFIKAVKRCIGKDFRKYSFLSYPLDNYGVLTFYRTSPTTNHMISPSFKTIGKDKPTNPDEWLKMDNNVEIGEGPSIELSDKSQREMSVSTILPKLFNILKISGKYKQESVVESHVHFNAGYSRVMDPDKAVALIQKIPSVNTGYVNKDLVYVYADFVINNMVVDIAVTGDMEGSLDAGLSGFPTVDNVTTVGDVDLNFSVKKNSKGSYTVTFNRPLIIARLLKYQPSDGTLESTGDVAIAKVPDPSLLVARK